MSLMVEATYENRVLKPKQPVPLRKHETVRLRLEARQDAVERVRATAGLIPCAKDALIEQVTTDADLDFPAPETP